MKNIFVLIALLLASSSVHAAPFVPTRMKLTSLTTIQYSFDGSSFTLPVTVSGTPANVTFCVYTKDRASSIRKVQNGHLGWHYVNNIDTSVYISGPIQLNPGENTIRWDGRDDDGNPVPPGSYTYYLFGYDNVSKKQVVNASIMNPGGSNGKLAHIQEWKTTGAPLANPIFFGREADLIRSNAKVLCRPKWVIGNDPYDSLLIETTRHILPTGYTTAYAISLQPDNFNYYFLRCGINDPQQQEVRKMRWVPNGISEPVTTWGKQGIVSWSSPSSSNMSGGIQPGTEIIGDYLWTGTNYYYDYDKATAPLTVIDWQDGTIKKNIDISEWWSDTADKEGGGQLNGGPNGLNHRNGMLFLDCHCSCIQQMVDPARMDDMENFYVWTNQNGDYVLDRNYDAASSKKWVCNDYKVGPYTYNISPDNYGFNINSCYDIGAVSFGLLGPDGDGIGYFAYAGDTAGWKWFNIFVDNGSAYDGIYCDDNERYISPDGVVSATVHGIYYIAHDSIKGTIVSRNAYIFVASPTGGEIWESGTPHRIQWELGGVQKVKIEYSADNGSTWNMIADSIAADSYEWTPTGIESSQCLIRVSSAIEPSIRGVSSKPFTIISPFVKVVSPNGFEVWESGTQNTITWESLGAGAVKIDFSSDHGSSWTVVTPSVSATQRSFTWNVPNIPSEHCLVRVSDASNPSLSDTSDNVFRIVTILAVGEDMPQTFSVAPNHPNPFNPSTTIAFTLPERSPVTVAVYNVSGQRVATLLDGTVPAGRHSVIWNASGMSAGLYFCRVCTGREERTVKMLLVK